MRYPKPPRPGHKPKDYPPTPPFDAYYTTWKTRNGRRYRQRSAYRWWSLKKAQSFLRAGSEIPNFYPDQIVDAHGAKHEFDGGQTAYGEGGEVDGGGPDEDGAS